MDNPKIEINIFKIFKITWKSLFQNKIFKTWANLMFIFLLILWLFPENLTLRNFDLKEFMTSGITGLSFTLALMMATTKLFDSEKLAKIFLNDLNTNRTEFYDLMSAYLFTGLLWVLVALLALFDYFLNISNLYMKIVMIALVSGAILSLWNLLYGNIQDTMLSVKIQISDWSNKFK